MHDHCDLCGKPSDRLDVVDDLWGLGVSTLCADASECASEWGEGFEVDPSETQVLAVRPETWRADLDATAPLGRRGDTVRLPRQ